MIIVSTQLSGQETTPSKGFLVVPYSPSKLLNPRAASSTPKIQPSCPPALPSHQLCCSWAWWGSAQLPTHPAEAISPFFSVQSRRDLSLKTHGQEHTTAFSKNLLRVLANRCTHFQRLCPAASLIHSCSIPETRFPIQLCSSISPRLSSASPGLAFPGLTTLRLNPYSTH